MPWPPKYIDKVGIELEGGWINEPPSGTYHHDGSVATCAPIIGEFVSDPMEPLAAIEWLTNKEVYPAYVDPSCGLHVHFSVKDNRDYERLMKKSFNTTFLSRMKELGDMLHLPPGDPFWTRLDGGNSYCARNFQPDRQWTKEDKDAARYSQLNFCYGLHGTVECRLFPMFRSRSMAGKAVGFLLEVVDEYLANQRALRRREMPVKLVIEHEETEEAIVLESGRFPVIRSDNLDERWTCESCGYRNMSRHEHCYSCGDPRFRENDEDDNGDGR